MSERLPAPLRPAWSGPIRYWQDRSRLAVKGAIAAGGAWALARYAAGQADPYFAPLAALLGIYPTVARSMREVVGYLSGFGLGATLAVPVAIVLGPSITGIALVVLAGMLVGSWRRLGDQSAQVTFTALFVLLLGGHQPLHYLADRTVDVGIGVATGLAVNVLAFPPLQLRPAEHAISQWGSDIARALRNLASAVTSLHPDHQEWFGHDRRLVAAADQARAAAQHARESLRWNPRARAARSVPRPDGTVIDSLDVLTARTRVIAMSLLDGPTHDEEIKHVPAAFGEAYAAMLRALASAVLQLADLRSPRERDELAELRGCQQRLELQASELAVSGAQRSMMQMLTRISCDMIGELAGQRPAAASVNPVAATDGGALPRP